MITCGSVEENLANNREMAQALRRQGYDVDLDEVPDAHNYTGWRDAFDPHLTTLLRRVWARFPTGRPRAPEVTARAENRVELHSPAIGAAGTVVSYGHWGRPVLVFPSERGRAEDFANNGMVGGGRRPRRRGAGEAVLRRLVRRVSWSARDVPLEERARRHGAYESWIVDQVVPYIHEDCGGATDVIATGCSMGAFHALNFAFRRADLFPLALCFSGNYDPSRWHGWGERGDAAYFNNPADYVANLHGDHLDWLRSRLSVLLVCGQGQWEDTTGSLDSTRRDGWTARGKGIPHELDLWGHDVPHDWPSWRAQFAQAPATLLLTAPTA